MDSKTPLQSKKFVAYLVAELTWKGLLALLIFHGREAMPKSLFFLLLTIVLVAGFIEVGYIISVNALDKYTRLAQIAVSANGKLNGTAGKVIAKGTNGLIDLQPDPEPEPPEPEVEGEPELEPEPEAEPELEEETP